MFVISDGDPTDAWEDAAGALRSRRCHKPYQVIGLAIGDKVHHDVIERIAPVVIPLTGDLQQLEAGIEQYFTWIPEAVAKASDMHTTFSGRRDQMPHDLPPLPKAADD